MRRLVSVWRRDLGVVGPPHPSFRISPAGWHSHWSTA